MRLLIQIQPMLRLNYFSLTSAKPIPLIQIQPMLRLNRSRAGSHDYNNRIQIQPMLRLNLASGTDLSGTTEIQIQPMLRLNKKHTSPQLQKIFYSNTTNVKVKLIFKVQTGENSDGFKYNQC